MPVAALGASGGGGPAVANTPLAPNDKQPVRSATRAHAHTHSRLCQKSWGSAPGVLTLALRHPLPTRSHGPVRCPPSTIVYPPRVTAIISSLTGRWRVLLGVRWRWAGRRQHAARAKRQATGALGHACACTHTFEALPKVMGLCPRCLDACTEASSPHSFTRARAMPTIDHRISTPRDGHLLSHRPVAGAGRAR